MPAARQIQTLSDWLRALDLQTYEPLFTSNDIHFELLNEITADDLRDMGISSVGHRRTLLSAIEKLKEDSNPTSQLTESTPSISVRKTQLSRPQPSRGKPSAPAVNRHVL